MFSDTDFLPSPASVESTIGGTFAGGVTQVGYGDFGGPTNTLFDLTNGLCSNTFNSSPFKDACSKVYNGATPYSLTETILVNNPSQTNGQASGDHLLRSAPEPATLLLTGIGLLGLGFASRRRNTSA
jgi:hypothetical protein